MSEVKDMVTFHNIKRSYPPGEEMVVHYLIEAGSDLKTSKRDWVGLFRVGWTSSRDYYTFEWALERNSETNEGSVKFAGRRLPPEDGHFYQLCFVSRDGTVRGASAPFQFAPLSVCLEDMELVEITDDSMKSVMVLQKKSKEMESLRRESKDARVELGDVQRSLVVAKTNIETLGNENAGLRKELEANCKRFDAVQGELVALKTETEAEAERLKGELEEERRKTGEKDARILDLEHQVAAKSESEQHLIEQLGREQERSKELLGVKEHKEQEFIVLKERLSTVEGEVVVLMSEGEDLKQQLQIKDSQVDDLQRLVGTRGEELEQIAIKLEVCEQEKAELHAAFAEFRASLQRQEEIVQQQGSFHVDVNAALAQKDERIEKLEQELACSQANVAELFGAQQNHTTEQPQHGPSLPENMVDKGAYIALQQASETFEKYYTDEKTVKERLAVQLRNMQEESERLRAEHAEMMQRVVACKCEYESKAQECVELQRRLKKVGLPTTVDIEPKEIAGVEGSYGLKMEREQEEMIRNCQTAAEELSIRKRECDERSERISELEAEVAQAVQRSEAMQDHYDKKIAEKNEELQRQKLVFDEKAAELAAVTEARDEEMAKVTQLTDQIQGIKQHRAGEESSRSCPMCNMKFPLRMTEQDFERHVQAHFETV